jgi:hypothetical protein
MSTVTSINMIHKTVNEHRHALVVATFLVGCWLIETQVQMEGWRSGGNPSGECPLFLRPFFATDAWDRSKSSLPQLEIQLGELAQQIIASHHGPYASSREEDQ